jgi:hypothetical protein
VALLYTVGGELNLSPSGLVAVADIDGSRMTCTPHQSGKVSHDTRHKLVCIKGGHQGTKVNQQHNLEILTTAAFIHYNGTTPEPCCMLASERHEELEANIDCASI